MYFRNIILSAFVIAIITGLIFSAYQATFITPLIIGSEVYEISELNGHLGEEIEAWGPEDGLERHSWNFASNFLVCFAYALILLSAMNMKAPVDFVQGLFWGGAGYLSLFVAPAFGLPPEIPGMEAAYLEGRQAWWLLTVCSTALSIWLIAFQSTVYRVLGVCFMIFPHLIGAPQPEIHGFANTNPEAIEELTRLWHQFILQTSLANALLWFILGICSSFFSNKYIISLDKVENKCEQ